MADAANIGGAAHDKMEELDFSPRQEGASSVSQSSAHLPTR